MLKLSNSHINKEDMNNMMTNNGLISPLVGSIANSPTGSKNKPLKLILESLKDEDMGNWEKTKAIYYDEKTRILPSEFAESAKGSRLGSTKTILPMIQGSGKFSYAKPILPKK